VQWYFLVKITITFPSFDFGDAGGQCTRQFSSRSIAFHSVFIHVIHRWQKIFIDPY
jgi:hypothetical protein